MRGDVEQVSESERDKKPVGSPLQKLHQLLLHFLVHEGELLHVSCIINMLVERGTLPQSVLKTGIPRSTRRRVRPSTSRVTQCTSAVSQFFPGPSMSKDREGSSESSNSGIILQIRRKDKREELYG